jgi:carboxymethylenebutenolidase
MENVVQKLLCLIFLVASVTATADVPFEPTANDELPPAITGNAGPLQGSNVAYYPGNDKTLGYLAVPETPGPHGAIILIHEWTGLVERVKETADSFAAEGYIVLAADMYSGQIGTTSEESMALMNGSRANPDEIINNLNAAVRYLESRSDTTGKIGAIGWCYGGGVALSFALGGEEHDATAIFYGRLSDDPEEMKKIHHEVYGTFARNDSGIPVDLVNSFVSALRAVGIENDVHIYDHISHGFWLHVDRDPELNTAPALDAWQRLKAYFSRTIGG